MKDGNSDHITREPEQVKAFRDTWRDGIHSYLSYLRGRLTVARDLLTDSGSIFVQIGDENIHRVRALMDEVFGEENFAVLIAFQKTSAQSSPNARTNVLTSVADYLLWYARDITTVKFRDVFVRKGWGDEDSGNSRYVEQNDGVRRAMTSTELGSSGVSPSSGRVYRIDNMTSAQTYTGASEPYFYEGTA